MLKKIAGHILTALISVAVSCVYTTTVNVNIVTNINKVEQKLETMKVEQVRMMKVLEK